MLFLSYLVKNRMDRFFVICKLAMKWYLMHMCASYCVPDMDNFSRVVPLIRTFWWQYLSLYDCVWLFYLDVNQNCTVQFKPRGICLFDLNKKAGCGSLKDILTPRSTLHWRNLKTRQLPVILDLCLGKTRAEKSRDYRDVIAFREAPFSKCFSSTLKPVSPV